MTNIPKVFSEQVKQWNIDPNEEKELRESLEEYFTLRKKRIESSLKPVKGDEKDGFD